MKTWLLGYLCDPVDGSPLKFIGTAHGDTINEGYLVGTKKYPIINGVPRFITLSQETVHAFGEQWNYFNFDSHKLQWLGHTVKNGFGSPNYFKGKTVVDCGAGHGMQSRWMAEAGAERVIALELSHSVDGIMRKNLKGLEDKVQVIQCSIDRPPLRGINGLVICHNVIQHTPSVEKTAKALWGILDKGEFAFTCYTRDDSTFAQRARFAFSGALRGLLKRCPFIVRLAYSHLMAALRFIPVLGYVLEKSWMVSRGDVQKGPHYLKRLYTSAVVNTFDAYGGHDFQHHLSFDEQRSIAKKLQPDESKWKNAKEYFSRPMPIGVSLRLLKP